MSVDVFRVAGELVERREPFAVATVVKVQGSSSAKVGAKSIIAADGKTLAGWVGGGCAESAVRSEAKRCIRDGVVSTITLDMMDEVLGVGMPCGGMMDVYIEPVLPKPRMLILGHGKIAEVLAEFAYAMEFDVTIDDSLADREHFPHAAELINDDMDYSRAKVGADTYVVIATQHKGDHIWVEKALKGNAAYIALIASRKRSRLVFEYAAEAGVSEEAMRRISAPAGLDIGAQTPQEIALSIMSEIVALRRGKSGGVQRKMSSKEQNGQASENAKVISQCDMPGLAVSSAER